MTNHAITYDNIIDDIDDTDNHALSCACTDCIDNLIDELEQDRVA